MFKIHIYFKNFKYQIIVKLNSGNNYNVSISLAV